MYGFVGSMKRAGVFGIDVVDPELRLTVNPSRFGKRFFVGAELDQPFKMLICIDDRPERVR